MTIKPDPVTPAPAEAPAGALPPGHQDFAGEIRVENGKMPRWFMRVPYLALLAALGYYLYVRAFDPVNLVFGAVFVVWMIYTPIAQKRGWFFIPM